MLVGNMYAEEDAHMVSVLREAGAVFFVSESPITLKSDRRNNQTLKA